MLLKYCFVYASRYEEMRLSLVFINWISYDAWHSQRSRHLWDSGSSVLSPWLLNASCTQVCWGTQTCTCHRRASCTAWWSSWSLQSVCAVERPVTAIGKDLGVSAETFLELKDFLLSDVWLTLGCGSPVLALSAPAVLLGSPLHVGRVVARFQLRSVGEQSWVFLVSLVVFCIS